MKKRLTLDEHKTHTPGPWFLAGKETCRIYARSEGHAIARTYGPDLNGIGVCALTGPNNKADARLISAAPEMLEALRLCDSLLRKKVVESSGDQSLMGFCNAIKLIDKVIKKAVK